MQKARRRLERKALRATVVVSELKLRPKRLRQTAWVEREIRAARKASGFPGGNGRDAEIAEEMS
jgi:hypothetical protein